MARIPMYSRVQTEEDLQNLVTGIILRQTEPFTEEEITKQVMEKLHGSYFENKEETVKEKVAHTIHHMWLAKQFRPVKAGVTPTKWRFTASFPAYNPEMRNPEKPKKANTPKKQDKKK